MKRSRVSFWVTYPWLRWIHPSVYPRLSQLPFLSPLRRQRKRDLEWRRKAGAERRPEAAAEEEEEETENGVEDAPKVVVESAEG